MIEKGSRQRYKSVENNTLGECLCREPGRKNGYRKKQKASLKLREKGDKDHEDGKDEGRRQGRYGECGP